MYLPDADSEFMAEFLTKVIKSENPKTFLDMGCGSGIQSKAAIDAGILKKDILAVDTEEATLEETKKLGIRVLKSDLFKNVEGMFDLIAFNPPYLPADEHDKEKDTTGGKKGYEIIEMFLHEAGRYLTKNGKILLLFSSLTNRREVEKLIRANGFDHKLLAKKNLFMEELYLVLFERKR